MPATNELQFEEDIKIDKYALDTEWEHQAEIYKRYSDAWANAYAEMELAKEARDLKEADLDAYIRTNAEAIYPGARMTEAAIKNWVRSHEEYLAYSRDYIEAVRTMNILAGAKTAFEHRKRALESLVQLHGQQYFAKPTIPHRVEEAVTEERRSKHITALNQPEKEIEISTRRRRAL